MSRVIMGLLTLALATSVTAACSIKKMAINSLADTLAASGDGFASDEDPDLIRDAVPFSLKTIESLLVAALATPQLSHLLQRAVLDPRVVSRLDVLADPEIPPVMLIGSPA